MSRVTPAYSYTLSHGYTRSPEGICGWASGDAEDGCDPDLVALRTADLDDEVRRRVRDDATSVAFDAFENRVVGMRAPAVLWRHPHAILSYRLGEPVAFAGFGHLTVGAAGVLYIAIAAVRHQFQRQGHAVQLVSAAVRLLHEQGQRVEFVVASTQNPAVARSRAKYCDPVYPVPQWPTPAIRAIAREVKQRYAYSGPLDEDLLIERDRYRFPIGGSGTMTGDPVIDHFFAEHVGPHDGVYIVGALNHDRLFQCVART